MMTKKNSNKNVLITKESTGNIINNCFGFVVDNKNKDGLTRYNHINIPAEATFKVIRYNAATERLLVWLTITGMSTFIAELDQATILDNCIVENTNIYASIENIFFKREEKLVVSKETIRDILIVISFGLVMFLVGCFV